jgi:hypothetical protein
MEYIEKLKILTTNLEKCERVTRYSTQEENQADTLANGYIDMEASMTAITKKLIPQLYKADITSEEVDDIILDIGEELRHILYHINDTNVYDYLK